MLFEFNFTFYAKRIYSTFLSFLISGVNALLKLQGETEFFFARTHKQRLTDLQGFYMSKYDI